MNQEQINSNFQERLQDLEVQQEIIIAFLCATIETHSSPVALKKRFEIASDYIVASAIEKPLPESWFAQLAIVRDMLDRMIAQRIVEVNRNDP